MRQKAAVILGTGATVHCLHQTPPGSYVIGTDLWFERTSVDSVVTVEPKYLQRALNTLCCEVGLWTVSPWAQRFTINAIPGTQATAETSNSAAIRLALSLGYRTIHLLGYAQDLSVEVQSSRAIHTSGATFVIHANLLDLHWA